MTPEHVHPRTIHRPRPLADQETKPDTRRFGLRSLYPADRWARYLAVLALIVLATFLSALVVHLISPDNLVMIYVLAVVLAAVLLGRGPAILASVLGVLAFDFFIVPPQLTFAVADTQYLLTFLGLVVVGLVISQLTEQVREQLTTAQQREAEMAILYHLSRDLAVAGELTEITDAIIHSTTTSLGREAFILLPGSDADHTLKPTVEPGPDLTRDDLAVANWVFQQGQAASRDKPKNGACFTWQPLKTANGILGVMGFALGDDGGELAPEQRRLFESIASLAALGIERAQMEEAARTAELLRATDKLQTALLNSISHDLRTPLVSITGVLSSLQDETTPLDPATQKSLVDTAREEADRLNRLVGNLLDMTRIEAGAVKVAWQPCDLQDLVGAAVEQLDARLQDRPVTIDVPDDLPMVSLDFGLMVQVLTKLLDNALKYSQAGTPIEICARVTAGRTTIEVADRGIGIPPEDLRRVFGKFYRVQQANRVAGMGMGLSICKGIVEAHGGQIIAENRPGGGTLVRITLPPGEPPTKAEGRTP